MPALYELLEANVVDTLPTDIAAEFRKIRWEEEVKRAAEYAPQKGLDIILNGAKIGA
jgi:hypothetical protein